MADIEDDFDSLPEGTPIYKLLSACALGDTLYPEDEIVAFTGIPNEQMKPMNMAAKEAMKAYLTKLEDDHRKYCEKMNRPYTPRVTELSDQIALMMGDAKAEAAAKAEIYLPSKRSVPLRTDLIPVNQRKTRKVVLASRAPKADGKPKPIINVQGSSYDTDAASNSSL